MPGGVAALWPAVTPTVSVAGRPAGAEATIGPRLTLAAAVAATLAFFALSRSYVRVVCVCVRARVRAVAPARAL